MSRMSENVKAWRRRTKSRLVEAFGNKCCMCGQKYEDELYDFHHIDPTNKKFSMGSRRGSCISWERIVEEVKKCVMVCSNCHRLLHNGYASIPKNSTRFDEKYDTYEALKNKQCKVCKIAIEETKTVCSRSCAAKLTGSIDWGNINLTKLYEKFDGSLYKLADHLHISHGSIWKRWQKEKVKLICPVCGEKKDPKLKYCSQECYNKVIRKVDWSNIDVLNVLEEHKFNYVQAGKSLGVSDNAVRKRYKKVMGL